MESIPGHNFVNPFMERVVWKWSGICHISCLFSVGFLAKTFIRREQQVYCQLETPRLLRTLVKCLSYERSFSTLSFSSRGSLNITENVDTCSFETCYSNRKFGLRYILLLSTICHVNSRNMNEWPFLFWQTLPYLYFHLLIYYHPHPKDGGR